jgi:hypothetical protein
MKTFSFLPKKQYPSLLLLSFTLFIAGCGGTSSPTSNGAPDTAVTGTTVSDAIKTLPSTELNNDQRLSISYMWDEERMARDLYLALYDLHPSATPLYNIATRSETQHVGWVEDLAEKYNLNILEPLNLDSEYNAQLLADYPAGSFTSDDIKNLYDALYAEGANSEIDALKVGCKVEVTDVEDLDHYINAIAPPADDLVYAYQKLREGSYNHYWAFDNSLKQRGVSEGCCSLGDDFCHPEYPQ